MWILEDIYRNGGHLFWSVLTSTAEFVYLLHFGKKNWHHLKLGIATEVQFS